MQSRSYHSDSLTEGTGILSREWSRHRLSVQRGENLRLRFSIRSITPYMSLSTLAYGTQVMVLPQERADVLLLAQSHNHREALLRSTQGMAPHHVRLAEEFMHAHLNRPL